MFTQPRMYKAIRKHPHVLDLYSQSLIKSEVITDQEYQVCIVILEPQLTLANHVSQYIYCCTALSQPYH